MAHYSTSTHPFLSSASSSSTRCGSPAKSPAITNSPEQQHSNIDVEPQPSLGESILRQYATVIDPSHTNEGIRKDHQESLPQTAERETHNAPRESSRLKKVRVPGSPSNGVLSNPPRAFLAHRKGARSSEIPRQTIIKAMASRPTISGLGVAPLGIQGFPNFSSITEDGPPPMAPRDPSSYFSATLSNLKNMQLVSKQVATPPLWSPGVLRSPCYFHQRFEGVVDVQKVLDEISEEDYSHSRLMQTATGVREVSKQLSRKPLKRAVRSVMIVTRARDNRLVHLTRDLAEWLLSTPRYGSDLGVHVYVDAKLRHSKRFDAAGLVAKEPRFQHMLRYWTPDLCWSSPEKFDLVLTLGGDGTVLFTSWLFQRIVPPILSFALGSLGFLTNFEFDRYKEHLNSIMGDGGMRVNLRMRFTCTVWRQDKRPGAEKGSVEEGEQFEVLNELVIDRGPSAYVSNLELFGDDELLTVVQADGCIFSTPTGSTAYSLSAGGSLIHPSIPAILLTPICPHTLSFRPMVLSDTLSLPIAVPYRSRSSAYCSFDGKGRIELRQGDYVTLEASQYPFPTVMTGTNEWVESVQRALRWNVRGAEQKGWDTNEDEDGEEREAWDIDIDPAACETTDSGIGPSEDGDRLLMGTESPGKRGQLSLLNM